MDFFNRKKVAALQRELDELYQKYVAQARELNEANDLVRSVARDIRALTATVKEENIMRSDPAAVREAWERYQIIMKLMSRQ